MRPPAKSLQKFRDRVRALTARQWRRKNLKQVLGDLVSVVRGWGNYHRRYHVWTLLDRLDKWMWMSAFLEKKKAVRHQNRRIPTRWLNEQGFLSLCALLDGPRTL